MQTHKYLRTHKFLTHGSESPGGWNLHRSRYSILNWKYLWVQIQVTHECTRALPYFFISQPQQCKYTWIATSIPIVTTDEGRSIGRQSWKWKRDMKMRGREGNQVSRQPLAYVCISQLTTQTPHLVHFPNPSWFLVSKTKTSMFHLPNLSCWSLDLDFGSNQPSASCVTRSHPHRTKPSVPHQIVSPLPKNKPPKTKPWQLGSPPPTFRCHSFPSS